MSKAQAYFLLAVLTLVVALVSVADLRSTVKQYQATQPAKVYEDGSYTGCYEWGQCND